AGRRAAGRIERPRRPRCATRSSSWVGSTRRQLGSVRRVTGRRGGGSATTSARVIRASGLLLDKAHPVRIAELRRRDVRVVIVDESMILGEAARRVLSSMAVTTASAGTLHELSRAFEMHRVPDLLIVNVTPDLTGWQVAARVERAGYRGRDRKSTRLNSSHVSIS